MDELEKLLKSAKARKASKTDKSRGQESNAENAKEKFIKDEIIRIVFIESFIKHNLSVTLKIDYRHRAVLDRLLIGQIDLDFSVVLDD